LSPSTISSGNGKANHLGTLTTFDVADVTGNANADLIVSTILKNQSGDYGLAAGALAKSGSGTMQLTAVNTYTGATTINNGVLELTSTGQIAAASAISTTATTATFEVNGTHTVGTISGGGNTDILAGSAVTATSVSQGTLTIGAGATLTIAAIPGGPLAGGMGSISPVPEPATWAMLMLAAMGLGIYRRRGR
jgi:autotransporter-associated beta strand protein